MYFSHLECSVPCGVGPFNARERHHLCPGCGMPLFARYDIARARAEWSRDSLFGRTPNMWRYREMLPLFPGEAPISLGEGFTPLLRTCRLGKSVGLDRLFIKDEAFNPTNSFKARGQSAAMTRASSALAPRRFMPVSTCRAHGRCGASALHARHSSSEPRIGVASDAMSECATSAFASNPFST